MDIIISMYKCNTVDILNILILYKEKLLRYGLSLIVHLLDIINTQTLCWVPKLKIRIFLFVSGFRLILFSSLGLVKAHVKINLCLPHATCQ